MSVQPFQSRPVFFIPSQVAYAALRDEVALPIHYILYYQMTGKNLAITGHTVI